MLKWTLSGDVSAWDSLRVATTGRTFANIDKHDKMSLTFFYIRDDGDVDPDDFAANVVHAAPIPGLPSVSFWPGS